MLALHSTATTSRDQGDLYKVLVLDRFCKDIIAPLLRVNELRSQGVTLHLLLEAERQPIPDVPAVYFIQPSAANVDRIVQDAQQALYEAMHINFATSVPSRFLEQLATGVVKANAVDKVAKIYDEYLAFIALEPSMFSLGLPDCYLSLNDPSAKEMQIEVSYKSGGAMGVKFLSATGADADADADILQLLQQKLRGAGSGIWHAGQCQQHISRNALATTYGSHINLLCCVVWPSFQQC